MVTTGSMMYAYMCLSVLVLYGTYDTYNNINMFCYFAEVVANSS